jgi:hypothetical protein
VYFDQLSRIISMHEEQYMISKLFFSACRLTFCKTIEIFYQILACLHLVTSNNVSVLWIVLVFCKLVCMFDVGYCSVEIDFIEHNLFLTVVFLLSLLFGSFSLFCHGNIFHLYFILDLLFMYNNCVRVVLYCFFVTSKSKFGICFAEIVLNHMIITIFKCFSNVFQGRLILLKLIIECWYQIVNKTVFLIRNEAMSEQLFSRKQNFFIIILSLFAWLSKTFILFLALKLAIKIDIAQRFHHVEVVENKCTIYMTRLSFWVRLVYQSLDLC